MKVSVWRLAGRWSQRKESGRNGTY